MKLKLVFDDPNGGVFDDGADETVGEPDQILHLKRGTLGNDEFWTLDQLASQPSFYPLGKSSDAIACKQKSPGTDRESVKQYQDCARQQRAIVNAPACAAFAKRVGNLLGIVDAEKEAATCGAVQPVTTKLAPEPTATPGDLITQDAKPQPTNPGDSSSFAKPRVSDAEFMSKAELNRKDLLTILSPVCPSQFKDVK
jgi:hypothetical protein